MFSASDQTEVLDPYQVLGVPRTASAEEIKSAYRRLAKETHPDLHGGSQKYSEQFRAVTQAYALLSDPVQRSQYDQTASVDEAQLAAAMEEIYQAVAYVRMRAAEAKAAAHSSAMRGTAWLLGGIVVSLIGFASASSSGGSYPIFWGAIVFGGIQAIRGFSARARIDSQARAMEQNIWNLVTGAT